MQRIIEFELFYKISIYFFLYLTYNFIYDLNSCNCITFLN